jgi:hypothetical protein
MPSIEFAYEKENVRVYTVTFKALVGVNGFITFGDESASKPLGIESIAPNSGGTAGGEPVLITGFGLTAVTSVTIDAVSCTGLEILSATQLLCITPAGTAGAKDVVITDGSNPDTLTGGYTYV